MTILVLLILAILWGAVLVPPALRARAESSPVDSIGTFRRQLSVLQRTGPVTGPIDGRLTPPAAPHGYGYGRPVSRATASARTQKRRREVLGSLLIAMGATLLLGFLPAFRALWTLHVVLDLLFVAYVVVLIRMRNVAAEREMKVRFLPGRATPEPALLLRRTGN